MHTHENFFYIYPTGLTVVLSNRLTGPRDCTQYINTTCTRHHYATISHNSPHRIMIRFFMYHLSHKTFIMKRYYYQLEFLRRHTNFSKYSRLLIAYKIRKLRSSKILQFIIVESIIEIFFFPSLSFFFGSYNNIPEKKKYAAL